MIRRRLAALLLLAAAAPLFSGCAFARRTMPMDASGMEFPAHVWNGHLHDQVDRTGARITGLPAATARHVERSWGRLVHGPVTLESKAVRVPTATGGVAWR